MSTLLSSEATSEGTWEAAGTSLQCLLHSYSSSWSRVPSSPQVSLAELTLITQLPLIGQKHDNLSLNMSVAYYMCIQNCSLHIKEYRIFLIRLLIMFNIIWCGNVGWYVVVSYFILFVCWIMDYRCDICFILQTYFLFKHFQKMYVYFWMFVFFQSTHKPLVKTCNILHGFKWTIWSRIGLEAVIWKKIEHQI